MPLPPPPPMHTDAEVEALVQKYRRVLKENQFKPDHITDHADAYRKGLLMEREVNYPAPAAPDDFKTPPVKTALIAAKEKRAQQKNPPPPADWEVRIVRTFNDYYHRNRTPMPPAPPAHTARANHGRYDGNYGRYDGNTRSYDGNYGGYDDMQL